MGIACMEQHGAPQRPGYERQLPAPEEAAPDPEEGYPERKPGDVWEVSYRTFADRTARGKIRLGQRHGSGRGWRCENLSGASFPNWVNDDYWKPGHIPNSTMKLVSRSAAPPEPHRCLKPRVVLVPQRGDDHGQRRGPRQPLREREEHQRGRGAIGGRD